MGQRITAPFSPSSVVQLTISSCLYYGLSKVPNSGPWQPPPKRCGDVFKDMSRICGGTGESPNRLGHLTPTISLIQCIRTNHLIATVKAAAKAAKGLDGVFLTIFGHTELAVSESPYAAPRFAADEPGEVILDSGTHHCSGAG